MLIKALVMARLVSRRATGVQPMPFRHVLITGASAGLGAAFARVLARPGAVLHLGARRAEALAAVAEDCRARGASVTTRLVDVRDAAAMADWVRGAGRLDLVLANAGVSAGTGTAQEQDARVRLIFETNLTGVLNTALPALEVMAAQAPGEDGWRGHVAVVSSIAGFVAAPTAPAYCASKAAARAWAEARDATERRRGLRVHALCPGFIRTAMTADNPFPMPWMMSPEVAARRALAGIVAGRTRIAYPRRLYALTRLTGALPPGLLNRLMMLAPGKPAG
ncbi:MAG: SDR family NAD(P)-dependent oxidoreductase [Roseococcus sp.]|nr:SDR family NAD(P)-dependent oxidoreductase [Roseococcus sp.]